MGTDGVKEGGVVGRGRVPQPLEGDADRRCPSEHPSIRASSERRSECGAPSEGGRDAAGPAGHRFQWMLLAQPFPARRQNESLPPTHPLLCLRCKKDRKRGVRGWGGRREVWEKEKKPFLCSRGA